MVRAVVAVAPEQVANGGVGQVRDELLEQRGQLGRVGGEWAGRGRWKR